ncbi:MAG: hypothetical protein IT339_08940 [Thermomicrobiales bacterium]|nr:hypothetical protein [Thermomicrobiales bacterium]
MARIVIRTVGYRFDTITQRGITDEVVPDHHASAVAVIEIAALNRTGTTGRVFGNAVITAAILVVSTTRAAAGGIGGRANTMAADIVIAAGIAIAACIVDGDAGGDTGSLPVADRAMRCAEVDARSVLECLTKIRIADRIGAALVIRNALSVLVEIRAALFPILVAPRFADAVVAFEAGRTVAVGFAAW